MFRVRLMGRHKIDDDDTPRLVSKTQFGAGNSMYTKVAEFWRYPATFIWPVGNFISGDRDITFWLGAKS